MTLPRLTNVAVLAVMAATTFVAVTAFVLAYDGSRGAAMDAGIEQAGWYPFCIEGVIVCASVATLRLRRRFYPWVILLAFSAVSVAANVLHAWEQPGWQWWSLAFAAVPPLALPICVHLLLMVGRPRGEAVAGSQEVREEVADAGGSGPLEPESDPSAPGQAGQAGLSGLMSTVAGSPGNGHGKTKVAKAVATVAAYRERNAGRLPSRPELALLAGVSESTARDALALTRKD